MPSTSPIKLKVWGEYACFTRPEMKVERVSYDVITPSAARGVLEAIYWKPQVRWVIERLHVLKPIRFTNIRRNEVSAKLPEGAARQAMKGTASEPLALFIEETRQQRAATILCDVAYAIEARFELLDPTETIEKHYNMFKRRAEKGQYFHHPFLGCREFPCEFDWIDGQIPEADASLRGTRDLGYLLHDIEYRPTSASKGGTVCAHTGERRDTLPHFFRAEMHNGVIEVPVLVQARGEVQP
jgi:CRISPR-associated protein Cas5d